MTAGPYQQCLSEMFRLHRFGIKLELDTIEYILASIDNPQDKLQCIHIAGTNGKGSIAAMLSTIIQAAGYQVGRYTSPHLESFNERICVNNQPITDDDVIVAYEKVQAVKPPLRQPTFFEFATAMALFEFARKKVDWAVIETGMGGRMDATNVIHPAISIITNISLEHRYYLGDTIAAIAGEKAGIIKHRTPVITGVQQQSAWRVISEQATAKQAPVFRKGRDFYNRRQKNNKLTYFGMNSTWRGLALNLEGEHQVGNTALALAACETLMNDGKIQLDEKSILSGLAQTNWPGRLEVVLTSPYLVLDGAHNLMAARALAKYIKTTFKGRRITLVIGILNDKPYRSILKMLSEPCQRVIITQPIIERAIPAAVLGREAQQVCSNVEVVPEVGQAIRHAIESSNPDDVICVAGSLYVVGEAKTAIREMKQQNQGIICGVP